MASSISSSGFVGGSEEDFFFCQQFLVSFPGLAQRRSETGILENFLLFFPLSLFSPSPYDDEVGGIKRDNERLKDKKNLFLLCYVEKPQPAFFPSLKKKFNRDVCAEGGWVEVISQKKGITGPHV